MEGEEQNAGATAVKPKKSKLWLVLIVVLVLIGAGVGGYFVLAKKSSSGGILSSIIPNKFNPDCKYKDPDLCKFINNWKDVKFLTMTSSDIDKDGKTTTSTFKMEGKENSQITMTEGGTEKYNTIVLGKTTYTKDLTDGKWFKYTPTTPDSTVKAEESQINFDDKAAEAEDKTTYEKVGMEACGKLQCFKYKMIDPAVTDQTEYIYFDNKEYLLRKTRSELSDGSVAEATYDYSKFSLTEPSPVKEGNPYEALINAAATSTGQTVTPQSTSPTTTDTTSSSVGSSSSGDTGADSAPPSDSSSEEVPTGE